MIRNHVSYSLSINDLKMVRSVPPGGNWKNIPLSVPSKRLEQIRRSGGRTTLYGRLHWDKPSYTITTYFNRPGNGTYIHPLHDRLITAREAARLQSFPDNYIFVGTKGSLCKQIGNAVPPLLAYAIARQLKKKTTATKVLDLFCGSGGLSLGFAWAGYKIVAANDNFKAACATYRQNHTTATTLIEGDITDPEVKKELVRISRKGKVDIIVGGPPCQGFSYAGKRLIDDPRNFLYKEFVHMVAQIKPKVFLMENVEGILTSNDGKTFEEIKKNFTALGYKVSGRKMYAAQFGVPQKRKRVVIIGLRTGDPKTCFPSAILTDEKQYVSTRAGIGDLSPVTLEDHTALMTTAQSKFQKLMRGDITPASYASGLH